MRVELTRFRVKAGKSERVNEWMNILNQHKSDVLKTLEREQMLAEVIFREMIDGEEFLSWFSIQRDGSEPVEMSSHDLDWVHLEFWQDCIDPTYNPQDAVPQVVMIPYAIAQVMQAQVVQSVA